MIIKFYVNVLKSKNKKAKEIAGIKIIRYEESVYYANAENFKYRIMKTIGINPFHVLKEKKRREMQLRKRGEEKIFMNKLKNIFPRKNPSQNQKALVSI
jgi:hypothetical protein